MPTSRKNSSARAVEEASSDGVCTVVFLVYPERALKGPGGLRNHRTTTLLNHMVTVVVGVVEEVDAVVAAVVVLRIAHPKHRLKRRLRRLRR